MVGIFAYRSACETNRRNWASFGDGRCGGRNYNQPLLK